MNNEYFEILRFYYSPKCREKLLHFLHFFS